jgi:threonine/homoserine/homoserine lactone efflux protein
MLILFGKHGNLGRVLIGAAALVAGLVLHLALLALAGGVLLAWGGYQLVSRRAR